MMLRTLTVAWLLLVLWPSFAAADPPRYVEVARTEHFVVIARRSDLRESGQEGLVDRATLAKIGKSCATWLEHVYDEMVDGMHYLAPRPSRSLRSSRGTFGGTPLQGRTLVILRGFGKVRYGGFVRTSDCHIRLNLKALRLYESRIPRLREANYKILLGHELFHTIQLAYDVREAHWIGEATAKWMEHELDGMAQDFDGHQPLFVRHPWIALDRCRWKFTSSVGQTTGRSVVRTETIDERGRPYGAGIFFRFLSLQHPAKGDVVRRVWDACREPEGDNALAAIEQVCGGKPAFRDYFDRFAVGCLLDIHAPEECRHPRILGSGSARGRARTHDVPGWAEHYARSFRDPDSGCLTLDTGAPEASLDGWLEVLGSRHFALKPLPGSLPVGLEACVAVQAPEDEVSLQGVRHDGVAWRVYRGAPYVTYDRGAGVHALRIPGYDEARKRTFFVLTRYGSDQEGVPALLTQAKDYRMRLSSVCPPAVVEVALRQKGRDVHRTVWTPRKGGTHKDLLLERRRREVVGRVPRRSLGAAEVRVVFSTPVEAPSGESGPLLAFDEKPIPMSSADGGLTWKGTVDESLLGGEGSKHTVLVNALARPAGTPAVVPLDQDPGTVATCGWERWSGYERGGSGTLVRVRQLRPPKYTLTTTGSHEGPPPRTLRLHLEGRSSEDDPITRMWIDPGTTAAKETAAREVELEVGRRSTGAGDHVRWLETPRSGKKEILPNAPTAELTLLHTWWERGTHVYEIGLETQSGRERVKRYKVKVWKPGEGRPGDEKGTPGEAPEVVVRKARKPVEKGPGIQVLEIYARTRSGAPIRRVTLRPAASPVLTESDGSEANCAEPLTFRPGTLRVLYQLIYRFRPHSESHGNDYDAVVEVEDAAGGTASDTLRIHAN